MAFWNNNTISELCEKWIFYNYNYAYIRSEELRTRSGEVLYTREHKATLSNEKSCSYIDIDELRMYCDDDESLIAIKKKYMDMLDKVNNKINNITDGNKIITKVNAKVKKKIELINKSSLFVLQKASCLRLAELNKIDAIIDDALNLIWNMICKKN